MRPTQSSGRSRKARTPTTFLRSPRSIRTCSGSPSSPPTVRSTPLVMCKTEVSIQSISKVFTMAQVIQEQGPDAIEKRIGVDATGARFNSIIAVEAVRTVSRHRSAGDEPAGESGRDLGDEHGDGSDIGCGVGEDHRLPQRRRGTTAERAAGRLQVRVRHQPAQPGHRRAHARLRLHQGQLAAGGRPLHASVLDRREREGSRHDGGDARSGRQESGHRQTGH